MRIGIDAKRIFLNDTGLGTYGRNLINGLNQIENRNEYVLYSTRKSKRLNLSVLNKSFTTFFSSAKIKAFWRSYSILDNLKKDEIALYHGLSSELPFSLKKQTTIKRVVDIHDLLFLRFPDFYSITDRKMFELKTKFACDIADKIIATSLATKEDIIKHYNIESEKIEVVYQSCDDAFFETVAAKERKNIRKKYKLPEEYILCVGTIQERKNQKQILEALKLSKTKIPLVLVGSGKKYKDELVDFAKKNDLVLFIPDKFVKNEDLPAVYQMAKIFVFPGLYEGFGIPVLEAMASKTPVITSLNTSMAEIIQDTNCLINPLSPQEIADKIDEFLNSENQEIVLKAFERAQEFTNKKFAQRVLKIYDEFRD